MSIEHVLPSTINDGLVERPKKFDAEITRFATGGRMARFWVDEVMKEYVGKLVPLNFNWTDIQEIKAFNRHIKGNIYPFWVIEPWTEDHTGVLCENKTDGLQDTFLVPVRDLDEVYGIFLDGARIYTLGAATHHIFPSANIIGNAPVAGTQDDNANFGYSTGDWVGVGSTLSWFQGDSADGRGCALVHTDGLLPATEGIRLDGAFTPVTDHGITTVTYTAHAWVKGVGSYKINLGTVGGFTVGPDVVCSPTSWTQLTVSHTFTLPGDNVAHVSVLRVEDTEVEFLVDCVGLAEGNNVKWFPPSKAPAVLMFDTAPTKGFEVTASFRGELMTRVGLDKGAIGWERKEIGHADTRNFTMLQVRDR